MLSIMRLIIMVGVMGRKKDKVTSVLEISIKVVF